MNALKLGVGILVFLLALCARPDPVSAAQASGHKLIEWGWDEPAVGWGPVNKPTNLRVNIAKMEEMPFDGVVMTAVGWNATGTRRIDLDKSSWGSEEFTRDEFKGAVDDLKATHFHRFTDNFLRLNLLPGTVGWYDDAGWRAICANGALASWICGEGGLKGIALDTEQYGPKMFSYMEQKTRENHTFEEYEAEVQERGRQYGKALTSVMPNITVLLTYSTSLIVFHNEVPLSDHPDGLIGAFVDGLLEGADKSATFIDGLEPAYADKQAAQFIQQKQTVRDAGAYSLDAPLYARRMTVGFGLWIDYQWRDPQYGWDPVNTAKNYFQPDQLRNSIALALKYTDKYAWIYSEKPNWWTGANLSPAYVNAVAAGKAEGEK